MFNKISLQVRLTLLIAVVLALVCGGLTYFSLYNARGTWTLMAETIEMTKVAMAKQVNSVTSITEITKATEVSAAQRINAGEELEQIKLVKLATEADRFKEDSLLYMLLIMLMGIGGVYLMLGKALQPMKNLSQTIGEIDQYHLAVRIEGIETQDEVGRLATAFNHMMDRLDASFMRQKQFVMNAAHELKTPLATMKTAVQVMELDETPSGEDTKETMEIIHGEIGRLSTLIDDLLGLADVGEEGTKTAVSIGEMLCAVKEELAESLGEKELTMEIETGAELTYYGNRELLYRLVFNLAENAIKYNRQGGFVGLTAKRENDNLVLLVEDSGVGISEAELPYIFQPLFRVEKSRNRKIAGAGLGLSIVQTIAEKLDGTVDVESIEGEGTTFTIRLPF